MSDVDDSLDNAIVAAKKLRDTDHSVAAKTAHSKQVGKMPTFLWSSRILAAIAKAEHLLKHPRWRYSGGGTPIEEMENPFTATEVALAKLALHLVGGDGVHPGPETWLCEDEHAAAIRAFTEKVESPD